MTPLQASPGNTTTTTETTTTTSVCCGCRPLSHKTRRRWKKLSRSVSSVGRLFPSTKQSVKTLLGRSTRYFDAEQGQEDWDQESLFFFDAEEVPLGENEYPVIHFTNSLQHPKPNVSLDEPESLLGPSTTRSRSSSRILSLGSGTLRRLESEPIPQSQREPSSFPPPKRSTLESKQLLEQPRIPIALQGYPGGLTVSELAECQKFLRGLKTLCIDNPGIHEHVYSFADVEEEPYTICRWLRATKFQASAILQRLVENQEMFDQAKAHDFYPDVSATIGAPFSVFLSQYPFLPIGRGKNGSPVNYFQAGKINPEGIMTLSTMQNLTGYFWWSFMYKFKQEIRKAQERDADFVRCEGINIIDLQGLSTSALSSETMEVIKIASKISDFFPETLHCMLVLNAPGFFAMSWGLIRKFIDPRTAQRIQVFSNTEKGLKALHQMVDKEQIPSDYGGTNLSVKDAFTKEAADPTLLRQEIELLHVKKRSMTHLVKSWTIREGERMEIRVYTRSVSAANIDFHVVNNNLETMVETIEAQCSFVSPEEDDDANPAHDTDTTAVDGMPQAQSFSLSKDLVGPCTISIEATDLDNAPKKHHHGHSRGYFLVVGEVKTSV